MARNMNGGINLHRKMFNNPILEGDRDSIALWVIILVLARWSREGIDEDLDKKNTVIFDGKPVVLKRGQIATSSKELEEWTGVPSSNIDRRLGWFEEDGMIKKRRCKNKKAKNKRGGGGTIITVVNYDSYQSGEDQKKIKRRSEEDQKKIKRGYANKDNKDNKENKENKVITTTTQKSGGGKKIIEKIKEEQLGIAINDQTDLIKWYYSVLNALGIKLSNRPNVEYAITKDIWDGLVDKDIDLLKTSIWEYIVDTYINKNSTSEIIHKISPSKYLLNWGEIIKHLQKIGVVKKSNYKTKKDKDEEMWDRINNPIFE